MRRRQQPVHLKDLDWYKFVRRYFWDDETTPYLIPVARLHRRQANHEIFAYVLFVSLLYGAVMLLTMAGQSPYGGSFAASLYSFVVVCVALTFGVTRHFLAACACVLAPVGVLVFGYLRESPADLAGWDWDRILLIGFSLVWLRYSTRLMHIAKRYPEMPRRRPRPEAAARPRCHGPASVKTPHTGDGHPVSMPGGRGIASPSRPSAEGLPWSTSSSARAGTLSDQSWRGGCCSPCTSSLRGA